MKNTLKCKKNNTFVHNFQLILSLKYKQTIMCNYLNNYDNLIWCSLHSVYIFMKNVQIMYSLFDHRGLLRFFFIPRLTTLKTTRENLKCQIFIQPFFKIVLYWCLDLICHNVGTPLKHNKYIYLIFLFLFVIIFTYLPILSNS